MSSGGGSGVGPIGPTAEIQNSGGSGEGPPGPTAEMQNAGGSGVSPTGPTAEMQNAGGSGEGPAGPTAEMQNSGGSGVSPTGPTAEMQELMSTNPKENLHSWEALLKWDPNAKRIEKQSEGVANDVWLVEINGQRAIARLGTRSDADLDWETMLLGFLGANGIRVPAPIPNLDGKLFANGVVVMEYLKGTKPETEADWRRVAETLKNVHALTRNWPQRPGWKSSADLITKTKGTKVDLTQMPAEGVTRCRNAWRKLTGTPQSVIHGDPNAGNILMTKDAVGLIDWDEAHFDYCALDLPLPHNAANLPEDELANIKQASAAWEAAVCWGDDYAKKRLAEVE